MNLHKLPLLSGYQRRLLIGGALALSAWPLHAQFRVEISGVGATQVPIALPAFKGEAGAPQAISSIVRADLERSGAFRAVDAAGAAVDENQAPLFSDWRSRGADALAGGSVTRLADGRYDVRFKLWDVVKGSELGAQALAVTVGDLRLAAHRIADVIYEKLTGDKGVFSTRIAYVTKAGKRYALHVADADGEGGQVALSSSHPLISPSWSPNGRELAYVSFESQKAVVYAQDVATGKRRVLANFRGSNSAPAWSPDGQTLVVTLSRDGGSQLFAISRQGGVPRRLTQSGAIDTEATFSPDGQSLFFVSDRGGAPQIYRMNAAGGEAQRVTFSGGYNISPSVSPDGRNLAFITRQGGAFKVMVQDLSGGAPRALSDTAHDERPSFAPNSRLIVYATRNQGRDVLMTTTLDGKIKTRLVVTNADVREPAWGPWNR